MFSDSSPELSPSIWVNGSQLQPWLLEYGWNLKILPPFEDTTNRFIEQFRGMPRIFNKLILPIKRFWQINQLARKADIVIVHKSITSMGVKPTLEKYLRSIHQHIIFNYDDAVHERGIPYLKERIQLADAVWVGNPVLVEYSRQFCSDVCLIESAVNCNHYLPKESYTLNAPPRLVWSGTPFSLDYLEKLRQPLRILKNHTDFVFTIICRKKFSFNDSKIREEWIPFSYLNELEYLMKADIALMPLNDGPYERAKENYKIKMFMACGLPVVCSPVGINNKFIEDGKRGFFADNHEMWVGNIMHLINNQSLRLTLGGNGRKFILENYSIPIIGQKMINLFKKILNEKTDLTD